MTIQKQELKANENQNYNNLRFYIYNFFPLTTLHNT